MTAISTALSGLNAASLAIDVVGNNLANLTTTGYKSTHVSFQDLLSESVGGSQTQVGLGVQRPVTTTVFSQGSIQMAGGPFDAAIKGNGFFVVKDANNQSLLTRAGDFRNDAAGNLITTTGQMVQGWQAGADGVINASGPTTNLLIPIGKTSPPKATSSFSLDANLDASSPTGTTFAQQIQAVDSLGNIVPLTVTFSKGVKPGQWTYQVSVPGNLTTGGTGAPVNLLTTPGTISFDSSGNLAAPLPAGNPVPLTVPALANGATLGPAGSMVVNWNFYNADGTPKLTQFVQASAVSTNAQDGQTASELTRVSLGSDGKIQAFYSNGVQQTFGQLALATVRNTQSLVGVGNNSYSLSGESSALTVGTSGTGGRGEIQGQALESSTVEISSEFANLLVFQRSYQANSRVITASDELVQDTMALIK